MTDEASRETPASGTALFTPRKLAIQILGFVIGIALLAWCIRIAVAGADWEQIRAASPLLVAGLAGCSIVSLAANGAIFWLVAQPLHRVRLRDMELLNLVVALLNYAPIRLGLISRVAYNVRVDRMPIVHIGAWLAALGCMLMLTLGACILATIVRPRIDVAWAAILLGQLLIGGLLLRAMMGQSIVLRYGRGMEQMLSRPAPLWGGLALRLVDIGAFVGRMGFAVAILGLDLAPSDVFLLGFAALTTSLSPVGRTGFREIAVAFVASHLTGADLTAAQVNAEMAALALIESAGEAMVSIPLGAIALVWYRKRWIGAARDGRDRPVE